MYVKSLGPPENRYLEYYLQMSFKEDKMSQKNNGSGVVRFHLVEIHIYGTQWDIWPHGFAIFMSLTEPEPIM